MWLRADLANTRQRQGVGRPTKVHNPGVVNFKTSTGDSWVVAVVLRSEKITRTEVIDEELHNLRSSLE